MASLVEVLCFESTKSWLYTSIYIY